MFKEFFRGKRGYVVDENGVPQKKRRSAVLIIIAAAVLILALSGRGTEKPKKSAETAPNTEFDIAAYTRETEQRLAELDSGMKHDAEEKISEHKAAVQKAADKELKALEDDFGKKRGALENAFAAGKASWIKEITDNVKEG